MEEYEVELSKIITDFQLKILINKDKVGSVKITSRDINRPGLELAGYTEHFSFERIQLIGMVEISYLASLTREVRLDKLEKFFTFNVPCIIISRGLEPFPEMLEIAGKYGVPILSTDVTTTEFSSDISRYLNVQLAPREVMHAGLVEVYGEGVMIVGNSGVGKSETALELIKRGHRLVADDLVEVRKVSTRTLVGSAPDVIRHFIEIRGIGFLDVRKIYGVGSVKMTENIQLVISLENWVEGKDYDRIGLEEHYIEIMGIKVPNLMIPVRPGRNLAVIVEVAAMNNRLKMMGYNAAKELNRRVFEPDVLPGSSFDIDTDAYYWPTK
jgi:HPr kinase/phosphorylase